MVDSPAGSPPNAGLRPANTADDPVFATHSGNQVVFRSTEWDGPQPAPGDVLSTDFENYVVTSVAIGAGLGHYRIEAYEARTITWAGTAPTRE